MAIPINKYIDIKSKVVQGTVGKRDFSGLVFTADSILTTAPSDIKASYDAGEVVQLTKEGVAACFADTTLVSKFAGNYFGYNGGNSVPTTLNVVKVLTNSGTQETAKAAYTRVTDKFTNFGAFTFLGNFTLGTKGGNGLLDVATANDSSASVFVYVSTAKADATGLNGLAMTHFYIAADATDKATAAWMPIAWYASVDYDKANASSTIDYKQFGGSVASVTDGTTKDEYDALNANYVGLVQVNGRNLQFYQTGVNMDGTDTGVVRDRVWMESEIASRWFNLTASASKVPANYTGEAMVRSMVIDVATNAISNGVILVDKPLDSTQIATIVSYTGDDNAPASVESDGYYIDTKIVKEGNKYICQYTLVYAKGDHIGKVTGSNYLV